MLITSLSEQQLLALAISNEEEDSRIYRAFAVNLRESYPATAKVFEGMAEEESGHRTQLYDLYRVKFGVPGVRLTIGRTLVKSELIQ